MSLKQWGRRERPPAKKGIGISTAILCPFTADLAHKRQNSAPPPFMAQLFSALNYPQFTNYTPQNGIISSFSACILNQRTSVRLLRLPCQTEGFRKNNIRINSDNARWAIMASATFAKPAILAPITKVSLWPYSAAARCGCGNHNIFQLSVYFLKGPGRAACCSGSFKSRSMRRLRLQPCRRKVPCWR